MKILPDFISRNIPGLEEAIEELRLSIIDHISEVYACLNIDALNSDQIRDKLRVLGLTTDSMSSEWIPNSKFYRTYALLRKDRCMKNALDNIIHTGGQLEPSWSSITSDTEAFKAIDLYRHYENTSIRGKDGYFYIEGNLQGDQHLSNLKTDALLRLALPAGYTFMYTPWPKPNFPLDTCTTYNLYDLMYDKLVSDSDLVDEPYLYNTPYLNSHIEPGDPQHSYNTQWYNFGDAPSLSDPLRYWSTSLYLKYVSKTSFPDSTQVIPYFNTSPFVSDVLEHINILSTDFSYTFDLLQDLSLVMSQSLGHAKDYKSVFVSSTMMLSNFFNHTNEIPFLKSAYSINNICSDLASRTVINLEDHDSIISQPQRIDGVSRKLSLSLSEGLILNLGKGYITLEPALYYAPTKKIYRFTEAALKFVDISDSYGSDGSIILISSFEDIKTIKDTNTSTYKPIIHDILYDKYLLISHDNLMDAGKIDLDYILSNRYDLTSLEKSPCAKYIMWDHSNNICFAYPDCYRTIDGYPSETPLSDDIVVCKVYYLETQNTWMKNASPLDDWYDINITEDDEVIFRTAFASKISDFLRSNNSVAWQISIYDANKNMYLLNPDNSSNYLQSLQDWYTQGIDFISISDYIRTHV